jgi:hypothetical protein
MNMRKKPGGSTFDLGHWHITISITARLESLLILQISDLDPKSTPQLFYTYFYNHARRPRFEKLLYLELSRTRSYNRISLNNLGPSSRFISETAVT